MINLYITFQPLSVSKLKPYQCYNFMRFLICFAFKLLRHARCVHVYQRRFKRFENSRNFLPVPKFIFSYIQVCNHLYSIYIILKMKVPNQCEEENEREFVNRDSKQTSIQIHSRHDFQCPMRTLAMPSLKEEKNKFSNTISNSMELIYVEKMKRKKNDIQYRWKTT